ncbi:DUF502 domain-containing protein [bacterium]|nr:MAG: DUF502 domain-containing protein [bacterium]
MNHHSFLKKLSDFASKLFSSGLIAILPITITVSLLGSSVRLLIGWLTPLRQFIKPSILQMIPHAEIILAIFGVFIIGTLYNHFLFDRLLHAIELLVKKIPLVRLVYAGSKQLVKTFGSQEKMAFQRVVLIHFPRHGIYSIGFLTSQLSPEIAPSHLEQYYTIFIPTTPNPTSGFCIVAPEKELIPTNLSSQEAMAMIISGGIIQPESQMKKEKELFHA